MDSSKVTYYGRPEPTAYDRDRHAKMRLRPIGYGYHHVNRTFESVCCERCKQEITENSVRYTINKKEYHRECFRLESSQDF